MSQHEIKDNAEPSAARQITLVRPGEERPGRELRWQQLGYPSDEAYMIVMRRLGRRRRGKTNLFRCTAPGGHK